MRADSVEYLHIPITGPNGTDISADAIDVSFDDGTTWHPAEWVNGEARILVGPGTTVGALTVGFVSVVVRVTDSPERPILDAGKLSVH